MNSLSDRTHENGEKGQKVFSEIEKKELKILRLMCKVENKDSSRGTEEDTHTDDDQMRGIVRKHCKPVTTEPRFNQKIYGPNDLFRSDPPMLHMADCATKSLACERKSPEYDFIAGSLKLTFIALIHKGESKAVYEKPQPVALS